MVREYSPFALLASWWCRFGDSEGSSPSMPTLDRIDVSNFKKTDRYMDLLRKVGKTLVVTAVIMTVVLLAYFLISSVARYPLPSLAEYAGMVVAFVLMFALVWYAGDSGQGKS